MDKELSTTEAAQYLNSKGFKVSSVTVRLWCRQGKFPNAREEETPRGKFWLIPASDLNNFQKPEMGRPAKKKES